MWWYPVVDQQIRHGQVLQASLHFVDFGLYAVTYRPDPAGWEHHSLPVFQLGSCVADARQRVKSALKVAGYQAVTWTNSLTTISAQPFERVTGRGPSPRSQPAAQEFS